MDSTRRLNSDDFSRHQLQLVAYNMIREGTVREMILPGSFKHQSMTARWVVCMSDEFGVLLRCSVACTYL